MKIRGNKDDAEVINIPSYFLPNKLIAQTIAHKVSKNPKIPIRFFINDTPSIPVVNFTTNN